MQLTEISITGRVQGVGFRPFIYKLAQQFGLKGEVYNDDRGVVIKLMYDSEIPRFLDAVSTRHPQEAYIEDLQQRSIDSEQIYTGFSITQSIADAAHKTVTIPIDLGLCKECEEELFDPKNRRYLYPFISCTHCGPRYTMISELPYDRPKTSMRHFPMCPKCQEEYDDPNDSRFHAQPIGCFECGPTLTLKDRGMQELANGDKAIHQTILALKSGKIVALKGLGGYHLLCDAQNSNSVRELRKRKRRPHKPFALMLPSLEMAKAVADLDQHDRRQLHSSRRPILLAKRKAASKIAPEVAPQSDKLGIFLPYTPLHAILLKALTHPVVVTSANISGHPLCYTEEDIRKLADVWDLCLDHDRDILNPCDDSVIMSLPQHNSVIRRSRGMAPTPFVLPKKLSQKVLAVGGNQKNSVAIAFDNKVVISPYIGDIDSPDSVTLFQKQIDDLCRLYDFTPELIVCDKHPHYFPTQWAKQNPLPHKEVQHHYAHILSVMIDNDINEEVMGIAFDGTGLGDDGTLWGGEFFHARYDGYERIAHLKPLKLLGASQAIKEPRRVALSLLFEHFGQEALKLDHPVIREFGKEELTLLFHAYEKSLNTPLTSSMGRLFDAVAALGNLCMVQTFEGQSGQIMESLDDPSIQGHYPFTLRDQEIDYTPMIDPILQEKEPRRIVALFLNTVVEMVAAIVKEEKRPLVFSGGVFQNRALMIRLLKRFPDAKYAHNIPCNDGGLALGQIASLLGNGDA